MTRSIFKHEERIRQHHVWRHYLSAWCNENGTLFVKNHEDGSIFNPTPSRVAKVKHFYRINRIDDCELNLLLENARALGGERGKQIWRQIFEIIEPILSAQAGILGEAEHTIDAYKTNALELYHSDVENSAIPILEELRNGSLGFLDHDGTRRQFYNFLAHQVMRTRKMKYTILDSLRDVDAENVWGLLSIATSLNLGLNLFEGREQPKVMLLRTKGQVNMIAGDQPAVNLAAKVDSDLCIYYPISPKLAVLVHDRDYSHCYQEQLSDRDVLELNKTITTEAHHNTFAFEKKIDLTDKITVV